MFELSLTLLNTLKPYYPYLSLTALVWATYLYALRCGFVSDDHQGLGDYDGKLQGWEYGMVSRWVRYHLCGGNHPSGIKLPNGKDLPLGKSPRRHHTLSIIVFNACILLGYSFFSGLFGSRVAFIAMALFTVSPIGTQAIAWISALGYPLSLFWLLIILNYTSCVEFDVVSMFVFSLMTVMAINALFVAMALPLILLILGHTEYAITSSLISGFMCSKIVRQTIKIRSDEFKKQDMGHLTKIKARRFVVAIKTIFYYFEMLVWPNRLGLYHEWGNNVSPDLEKDDRRFWLGLVATLSLVAIFFLTPVFLIKFSILWFFAFIFIFLNWITIQQFVTERYLWIPSIGFYLIMAYALQSHEPLLYLIGGIYICRTWLHLPTYDDELRFYLSNTWNYQNSEIALANLGCTWIRLGAVGSALDTWHASHKANPDYDVPLANIYFHHRANAMLDVEHGNYESAIEKFKIAHKYIDLCCKCTVRHFKDDWDRELKAVTSWLENPLRLVIAEKKRLTDLRNSLTVRRSRPDEKDFIGIDESLSHIAQRLAHIEQILKNAPPAQIPDEKDIEPTKIVLPGSEEKK